MDTYTAIFYNSEDATLNLVRIGPDGDKEHSIPIAEFLTSSTGLPLILTDEGKLDIKK